MKKELQNIPYKTVICGGTFDRLHEGHKYFLRHVFSLGQRVLIGLTSDSYISENKKGEILPFQERLEELKTFLAKEGLLIRAEIFPIQDKYGKAIDPDIALDGIVVTAATIQGGNEINEKRQDRGLPVLRLITIPLIATSNKTVISSTSIREGKIGRQGELYLDEKWIKHVLFLPKQLREVLHKPFGTLFPGAIPQDLFSDPSGIVTVGDATTKRFNDEGVQQKISVIDFSIERKSLFHSIEELGFSGKEEITSVINPPGHLTPNVWESLRDLLSKNDDERKIVCVKGEEDLLVIPLILLLPLGWKLFYGQPKEGVVYIPITEKTKERIYNFLIQFVSD